MLPAEIITYLEARKIWTPSTPDYETALSTLGVEKESNPDFWEFYLHADDGPYLSGNSSHQLLQLCWHVLNTNYIENSKSLKASLKIPGHYVLLDGFEGGGGYFYDPQSDCVYDLIFGEVLSDFNNGKLSPKWGSFVLFLKYFFGI